MYKGPYHPHEVANLCSLALNRDRDDPLNKLHGLVTSSRHLVMRAFHELGPESDELLQEGRLPWHHMRVKEDKARFALEKEHVYEGEIRKGVSPKYIRANITLNDIIQLTQSGLFTLRKNESGQRSLNYLSYNKDDRESYCEFHTDFDSLGRPVRDYAHLFRAQLAGMPQPFYEVSSEYDNNALVPTYTTIARNFGERHRWKWKQEGENKISAKTVEGAVTYPQYYEHNMAGNEVEIVYGSGPDKFYGLLQLTHDQRGRIVKILAEHKGPRWLFYQGERNIEWEDEEPQAV